MSTVIKQIVKIALTFEDAAVFGDYVKAQINKNHKINSLYFLFYYSKQAQQFIEIIKQIYPYICESVSHGDYEFKKTTTQTYILCYEGTSILIKCFCKSYNLYHMSHILFEDNCMLMTQHELSAFTYENNRSIKNIINRNMNHLKNNTTSVIPAFTYVRNCADILYIIEHLQHNINNGKTIVKYDKYHHINLFYKEKINKQCGICLKKANGFIIKTNCKCFFHYGCFKNNILTNEPTSVSRCPRCGEKNII